MFMDFPLCEEVEVEWDGDAFKRMKNLKTLIIRNGLFSEGPKHLPNTLEYWNGGDILHRNCMRLETPTFICQEKRFQSGSVEYSPPEDEDEYSLLEDEDEYPLIEDEDEDEDEYSLLEGR
ncbi:hypothetical protein glysoja_026815 [Glycine soja]|uniref:Uncharacterized protein n=1 Tax=Glycine soja TaxID=3848 RepID=A0A0B2PW78_GLYSO|nr:hypothetical protein glysoja_026815 [Glycine soja]